MQENILLVEDAPDFQLMVKAALGKHYPLTVASSLTEARALLAKGDFKLLLLDVNLPDGDGFRFCAELRGKAEHPSPPVMFLTGRAELQDKLTGFSLGAEDYIVKPFEGLELRARVEAKLSRSRAKTQTEDLIVRGAVRLDVPAQRAFVIRGPGGQAVDLELTPIEFRILFHLVRNEDRVVSREQLLSTVWGKQTHVFDRATDKHVSSLRHKLGDQSTYIETVSRVGYRFTVKTAS